MLAAEELRVLRREAAAALKACQRLPGFAARFETLPSPPDPTRDWEWSTLTEVRLEGEGSVVRWEERPVSEIEQVDPDFVESARAGGRIRRGPGGVELVGVPTRPRVEYEPALDGYREAVEEFAKDFVFGAEWSARAVHDALRLKREIVVPQTPHRDFVRLPVDINVSIKAGEAVPAVVVSSLIEALQAAEPHPEQERAAAEHSRREEELEQRLSEQAHRSQQHRERWIAIKRSRLRDKSTRHTLGRDRDRMWAQAVRAIEQRLQGLPVGPAERKAYERAKPYLNAAVNGSWEARWPLHPTDADRLIAKQALGDDDASRSALAADRRSHAQPPEPNR